MKSFLVYFLLWMFVSLFGIRDNTVYPLTPTPRKPEMARLCAEITVFVLKTLHK